MARRLEISLNAYRKLEKGKTRILNEHVGKFAEKTGTSVAELVNGFEPISSATERINDIKENYDRKMRDLEDGYIKTIASLKADIERLNERLQDKDEIISMNRKLILRYEKELGLKTGDVGSSSLGWNDLRCHGVNPNFLMASMCSLVG